MAKKQNKKAKRATYTKKNNSKIDSNKQVSKVVEDKKIKDTQKNNEDKISNLYENKKETEVVQEQKEPISLEKTELANKTNEVKVEEKQNQDTKKEEKNIEHTIQIPTMNFESSIKTSFVDLLLKPKKYISSLRSQNISLSSSLVYILVKHGISVIGIVFFLTSLLNESAFSIARLNFTQASYLWFRITLFLFVGEVVSSFILSFIFKKKERVNELFFYSHQTGLIVMILMNILGIIFFFNQSFGIMLFCLIFIDLVYIKTNIIQKVFEIKDDAILWSTELYFFLFILIFLIFAIFFLNDLDVIINALI